MGHTLRLLSPLALTLRNLARRHARGALVLALGALALLLGIELLVEALLRRILDVPIGQRLAHHLMSMFLFSLQFLLAFSALINGLSAFFLSRDLDAVMTAPVGPGPLFLARTLEVAVTTGWMVVALLVPVLMAFGNLLAAPPGFFLVALVVPLPFVGTWVLAGIAAGLLVARVLPVRRTRELMRFFGVMGVAILIVIFRVLEPERLVEPDSFEKMASYLVSLHPESLERFPSYWLTEVLYGFLRFDFEFLFGHYLRLYLGAFALALAVTWGVYRTSYREALLRFQEAPPPPPRRPGGWVDALLAPLRVLPRGVRVMVTKDAKVLARSPEIWTQACLMGVILIIYGYNLRLLPVDTLESLQPGLGAMVAFANVAFMGFLLVAAALRFGFPAISMEGEAFLLVHVSPLGMRRYLTAKLLLNLAPLLALGLVLAGVAQGLLRPAWPLVVISYLDAVALSLAIGVMAMDFGARYRNLQATNFAHLPSGPGGIAFLVASMALVFAIVGLQAYPFWLYREWTVFHAVPTPGSRRLAWALLGASLALPLVAAIWFHRRAVTSLERGLE